MSLHVWREHNASGKCRICCTWKDCLALCPNLSSFLVNKIKVCDSLIRRIRHLWFRKLVPGITKTLRAFCKGEKMFVCTSFEIAAIYLSFSFLFSLLSLCNFRYDIVFLPPSFPIVAMENPCLTFIISSILESDEFLIIDVIHEVAHSWFGNAVTNATWEEMWLSEGLATYAQRRITTETYGIAAEMFFFVMCLANNWELAEWNICLGSSKGCSELYFVVVLEHRWPKLCFEHLGCLQSEVFLALGWINTWYGNRNFGWGVC